MASGFQWNSVNVEKKVMASQAKALTVASAFLADAMVRNIGSEGGGVKGYIVGRKRGKDGKIINRGRFVAKTKAALKRAPGRQVFFASPPGNFPGTRTGNLRNSIAFTRPKMVGGRLISKAGVASGFNAKGRGKPDNYGLWLEFGTLKMPPRPWIYRSFRQAAPAIGATYRETLRSELKARGLG